MFGSKKDDTTAIQDAINMLLSELAGHTGDSEEYARIVERMTELQKLKESNTPDRISKDVAVTAAANIAGILLILQHERAHVVTSKALAFVMKLR